MKACGVIVEYNPFHNGHKYHLTKSKEISQSDLIIAVMSGNFLQRGEPAILNKWRRAEMALLNGVDLVIELPSLFSTESAEFFAKASIKILDKLRVNSIVFGSEVGEIEKLENIVDFSGKEEFLDKLKVQLKEGKSYPNVMKELIEKEFGEGMLNPNNILGIEYIRAIKSINSKIKPLTIKREKVEYFQEDSVDKTASATGIRKMLKEKKYHELVEVVPTSTYEILMENIDDLAFLEDYYHFIKFKILNDKKSLETISDMEEGLWNRFYEKAIISENLDEFMKNFVNKRYTLSRTKRILVHILLNLKKDFRKMEPPFIRVLAYNEIGAKYIKHLKKEFKINLMTSNKNAKNYSGNMDVFQDELDRDNIYKLMHKYEDEKFAITNIDRKK